MSIIKVSVNRSGTEYPRSIGVPDHEHHYFHNVSICSTGGDAFADVVQFAIDESGRKDQANITLLSFGYLSGKFHTDKSFTFSGEKAHIRIEVV